MNLYKAETTIHVLTYVVGETQEEAQKVALKTWHNCFDEVNWNSLPDGEYSIDKVTQVFTPDPGHQGIAFCTNERMDNYHLCYFKDPTVQKKIANIRDQIKSLEQQLYDLESNK